MNQILKPEMNISEESYNILNSDIHKNQFKLFKSNQIYKFQFILSSLIACCFLIVFFIRIFQINEKEKISKGLMDIYNITTLYSNSSTYSSTLASTNSSLEANNSSQEPFVIGMIRIDKINVNYPILYESSKDLLQISLCRFAGPMPNEVGNLCIAGHNYVDYKFFSRLNELEKNDIIKIFDLSGRMIEYTVTKIYEAKPNDTSCTSQDTNGKNIITLLTCNNVSGKRLVIVAKPKGDL